MNLDAIGYDELLVIANMIGQHPVLFARHLFGDRPAGYVQATKDLGNYATNKAVALKLRKDGKINTALIYEKICENIYRRLPEYARW